MIRAPVNPRLLRWTRERAGIAQEELAAKFKKLPEWEDGQTQPSNRSPRWVMPCCTGRTSAPKVRRRSAAATMRCC